MHAQKTEKKQNTNSCQLALSGSDEESHNYFKKTKAGGFTLREKKDLNMAFN